MNEVIQRASRHRFPRRVGISLGVFATGLTFLVGPLSTISETLIIGLLPISAMVFIMPGLFLSMILSGNVHDFSLSVAASANLIFYSSIGWLFTKILNRRKKPALSEN